jgi:hypothetical protein
LDLGTARVGEEKPQIHLLSQNKSFHLPLLHLFI